jgi:hypothetical protein
MIAMVMIGAVIDRMEIDRIEMMAMDIGGDLGGSAWAWGLP